MIVGVALRIRLMGQPQTYGPQVVVDEEMGDKEGLAKAKGSRPRAKAPVRGPQGEEHGSPQAVLASPM